MTDKEIDYLWEVVAFGANPNQMKPLFDEVRRARQSEARLLAAGERVVADYDRASILNGRGVDVTRLADMRAAIAAAGRKVSGE